MNEPRALKGRINIDRIEDLPETRGVREINPDHVANLVVGGVDALPAVDVVKLSGNRYGLLAGYHRREAHRQAGRKSMRVVIHNLEPEQWLPFAVRSNLTHGLPLSTNERKAAAWRMLDENPRRSDRDIATDCGLDHKTVGKVRCLHRDAQSEAGGDIPHLEERQGRDGKTYPVSTAPPQASAAAPTAPSEPTGAPRSADDWWQWFGAERRRLDETQVRLSVSQAAQVLGTIDENDRPRDIGGQAIPAIESLRHQVAVAVFGGAPQTPDCQQLRLFDDP